VRYAELPRGNRTTTTAETVPIGRDLSDHPFSALANAVAAVLFEILVPFCWEALLLLYLLARWNAP
jgi:hypothetical protein